MTDLVTSWFFSALRQATEPNYRLLEYYPNLLSMTDVGRSCGTEGPTDAIFESHRQVSRFGLAVRRMVGKRKDLGLIPVSYTHLTLPTNRLV